MLLPWKLPVRLFVSSKLPIKMHPVRKTFNEADGLPIHDIQPFLIRPAEQR